jgi:hypothetical protein
MTAEEAIHNARQYSDSLVWEFCERDAPPIDIAKKRAILEIAYCFPTFSEEQRFVLYVLLLSRSQLVAAMKNRDKLPEADRAQADADTEIAEQAFMQYKTILRNSDIIEKATSWQREIIEEQFLAVTFDEM